MANFNLFNTQSKSLPACDTLNASGAAAYAYTPKHQLAQLAVTGCLNSTFYATAESQLDQVLKLVAELDSRFVANAALYARQKGHMKDMPALLLAALTAQRSALVPEVFGQVVDSGKMLRNFVQILRSGATRRRSLGSQPKRLVQNWLNSATERQLLQASIGNQPSLADVVKMVHPKPSEAWREAFFAWVIGKPVDAQALPALTRDLLAFRSGASAQVPEVPFQLLGNETLSKEQWAAQARNMGWQGLRITLDPRDSVICNAEKLAGIFGGGTCSSAPLKKLADSKARVDTLIMVSDNESWIDARRQGASETMLQWKRIKRTNPQARLICIDLQPGWATPSADRDDILNVGGFSDAVFDVIEQFTAGRYGPQHWVEAIESMG